MQKYHYHIVFRATNDQGVVSVHSTTINAAEPIEYASDINLIQEWAAKKVNTKEAMLISWTMLKGSVRPENDDPSSSVEHTELLVKEAESLIYAIDYTLLVKGCGSEHHDYKTLECAKTECLQEARQKLIAQLGEEISLRPQK